MWAAEMYWIQEEEKYYMGMPWGEEAADATTPQRDDPDSDHARTDAESTDSEDWKMISNQRHTMRGVLNFLRMRKRWRMHQRQGYRALQRRSDPADQDPAAGPSNWCLCSLRFAMRPQEIGANGSAEADRSPAGTTATPPDRLLHTRKGSKHERGTPID